MKTIIIINGGSRKDFNTASMEYREENLQKACDAGKRMAENICK